MTLDEGEAAPDDLLPHVPLPVLDLDLPTSQQIHGALRAAILSLALPPGTRISETEAGARFGASRTPVREAMTWLRDEGLIVTRPSRGNFVTPLSEDGIRSAQFIREALEMAAMVRICANGLSPEDDERMAAALTAQGNAISLGDTAAFHAADDEFHAALAGATGLPRVRTLVVREKTALDRLRALRLNDVAHLRMLEDEHRRILNALRKGREDRARRVMTRHLTSVLDVLEDLKASHAHYFE
ncbi:GntR family transcriptional regulator [Roseibacterium sp. SDUM158016]|jgi:DNA-binding GntR family transcriptional regulator|uniref:GntR family transcriptional regulator n=1 Tax=Roseicyclus sediminis TaxID=2980997 RepID=UPI0021D1CB3C|nr:GntR family transcriptional regulator [Roseibacterium sp. SDUM158016]MCU4652413.1 GntR family transcriptional regulator [Roseibacterium sp. SDUM158016]